MVAPSRIFPRVADAPSPSSTPTTDRPHRSAAPTNPDEEEATAAAQAPTSTTTQLTCPSLLLHSLRRLGRALLALLLALLLLLGRLSRRVLRCRLTVTLRFENLPTLALVYVLLAEVIRLGTPKRYGAWVVGMCMCG